MAGVEDKTIDDVLLDGEIRMEKALEVLGRDLNTLRTGRATPALLENVTVDYYNSPTPLNQLATISAPEARLIVIQPWDKQSIKEIEKSLQKSEMGFNPSNDGSVIRLPIAPLTQERRRDLVKVLKTKGGGWEDRCAQRPPRHHRAAQGHGEEQANLPGRKPTGPGPDSKSH